MSKHRLHLHTTWISVFQRDLSVLVLPTRKSFPSASWQSGIFIIQLVGRRVGSLQQILWQAGHSDEGCAVCPTPPEWHKPDGAHQVLHRRAPWHTQALQPLTMSSPMEDWGLVPGEFLQLLWWAQDIYVLKLYLKVCGSTFSKTLHKPDARFENSCSYLYIAFTAKLHPPNRACWWQTAWLSNSSFYMVILLALKLLRAFSLSGRMFKQHSPCHVVRRHVYSKEGVLNTQPEGYWINPMLQPCVLHVAHGLDPAPHSLHTAQGVSPRKHRGPGVQSACDTLDRPPPRLPAVLNPVCMAWAAHAPCHPACSTHTEPRDDACCMAHRLGLAPYVLHGESVLVWPTDQLSNPHLAYRAGWVCHPCTKVLIQSSAKLMGRLPLDQAVRAEICERNIFVMCWWKEHMS